ncbi:MAG: metallophosphoesterase [Clostridiales bacterium]|jgi:putative phosphoesterase|nr:metallophosphoesterase [Clostridiales bacterium]
MKVLIVSDSHGRDKYLFQTLQKVSPIDLMIHLGDYGGTEEYIKSIANCPLEMISGNNDFFKEYPKDKVIKIGNYTVYLTHGHRYGVYYNTSQIKDAAKTRQADIVMFGHTHVPMIDLKDDIWAINPGSIALPRQRNRLPSFVIMDIDREGKAHFTINYCDG